MFEISLNSHVPVVTKFLMCFNSSIQIVIKFQIASYQYSHSTQNFKFVSALNMPTECLLSTCKFLQQICAFCLLLILNLLPDLYS